MACSPLSVSTLLLQRAFDKAEYSGLHGNIYQLPAMRLASELVGLIVMTSSCISQRLVVMKDCVSMREWLSARTTERAWSPTYS